MQVHDYYSDLLSNTYRFFNIQVFTTNKIRSIKYNIEDAAASLSLVDFSKLPSMVINYDSIDQDPNIPVSPRMFQFLPDLTGISLDQVKVLENHSKGISFYVQTRPYVLNLNMIVKVDTQLAALNMKHEILDSFPIGKLVQYTELGFVSFFQIEDKYLIPSINDVINDNISNLFLRSDSFGNTGRFFPMDFNPMVKLSSAPSVALDDKVAGSYVINFNLEVHIVSPFKFITDDRALNHDLIIKSQNNISASLASTIAVVPCYDGMIHILTESGELISFRSSDLPAYVSPAPSSIEVSGKSVGDSYVFTHDSGSGSLFVYSTIPTSPTSKVTTSTILDNGVVVLDGSIDYISMVFSGTLIDGSAVTLNLLDIKHTPIVQDLKLKPYTPYKLIPVRDLYSVVTVPPFRTTLNLVSSKILGVKVINLATDVITEQTLNVFFLPNGGFSFSVTSLSLLVFGTIDKNTSAITIDTDNTLYSAFSLTIDANYDLNPYGANIIESVSVDINNGIISTASSFDVHSNALATAQTRNINFLILLNNITTSSNVPSGPTGPYPYKFTIPIDPSAVTIDPRSGTLKYYIIFNSEHTDGFVLIEEQSSPTFLTFKCNESFKSLVLDQVSNTSPMYFGLT